MPKHVLVDTIQFNVKDYGAKGDGTTNDAPAIASAVTAAAAAGGGIVYFPAGTYRVTTMITVSNSGIRFRGAGKGSVTILQAGAMTSIVSFTGTLPAKASPTATLTADAGWSNASTTAGSTVTLSSVTGIAADDILLIGDDATIPWTGAQWGTRMNGELQRVKSVAGNVVTLYGRLRGSYTTARSASVHKLTPLTGVGVAEITFRNASPLTGALTGGAVNFYSCRNITVDNIDIVQTDGAGVNINYVFGGTLDRVGARDLADDPANNRYGYGINLGPSAGIKVSNGRFLRTRHGVTTNGWDGHRGYAHGFLVAHCTSDEATGAAFDTHPGSSGTFLGLKAGSNSDTAYSLRSEATLIDCEASYCNLGLYLQGAGSHDIKVTNFISHHTQGAGIATWGDAEAGYPTKVLIADAMVSDTQGTAVALNGALNGFTLARTVITRAGDAGANQAAAIGISADAGMTDVAILDTLVTGANSAVNLGANASGVTVSGTRSRGMLGLTGATIKGAGMDTANLFDNLDLDKPGTQGVPDLPSSSFFYTASPTSSSTGGLTVGSLRVVPWLIERSMRISELLADVVTAGEAGATARVGVYKDDGTGKPGALVIDSGSFSAAAAGVFGTSFSGVTLRPGLYWIGVVTQNAPTTQPVMRTIGSGWTPPVLISAGTSLPSTAGVAMGWQAGGITGALPTTFPTPGLTTFAGRTLARIA